MVTMETLAEELKSLEECINKLKVAISFDKRMNLYYNCGLDYAETNENYYNYIGSMDDKEKAISGQLGILQEECAELIQAVSKYKRGKDKALDKLKEEITHVCISIAMVSCALGINNEDIKFELNKKFGFFKQ